MRLVERAQQSPRVWGRQLGTPRPAQRCVRAAAASAAPGWPLPSVVCMHQQPQRRARTRLRAAELDAATVRASVLAPAAPHLASFGFRNGFYDDYSLGPSIGQGSFGVVHVARHLASGQRFAVKSIPKIFDGEFLDPAFVARVFHEVDVARHMGQSLNVIHLVEAYEDDVCVDLVMELAAGGSLWARIQRGGCSEATAARIIADMLRAVAQCHAKGVLVRDVKPENFLFLSARENSPLKMVDFGLATILSEAHSHVTERAGTPFYLAPEVLLQDASFPSDVWSAGIAAYQLLTGGRVPWASDPEWLSNLAGSGTGITVSEYANASHAVTNKALWRAILYAEFDFSWPPWDSVSEGARDLVQCMLQRDPGTRPTAAQLLQHPWLRAATERIYGAAGTASLDALSHVVARASAAGGGTSAAAVAAAADAAAADAAAADAAAADADSSSSSSGSAEAGQLQLPGTAAGSALAGVAVTAAAAAADSASVFGDRPLSDTLVQRLQRWGTWPRLKQLALRQVAVLMDSEASRPGSPCVLPACHAALADAFAQWAPDPDGRIPSDEVRRLLEANFDLSSLEACMLMRLVDVDRDGYVDLHEWTAALIDWSRIQQLPSWPHWSQQVFQQFDADGDGLLSADELHAVLAARPGSVADTVPAQLRLADANEDGQLSAAEFAQLLETARGDHLELFPSRRRIPQQQAVAASHW